MWNPSSYDYECNKACKIDEYLDNKNFCCKKHIIGKFVLERVDEILNITDTTDERVAYGKSNCFIHTISLVIICLLLLVAIYVCCCFYYKEYRSKQLFHDMDTKLEKIRD